MCFGFFSCMDQKQSRYQAHLSALASLLEEGEGDEEQASLALSRADRLLEVVESRGQGDAARLEIQAATAALYRAAGALFEEPSAVQWAEVRSCFERCQQLFSHHSAALGASCG